jgi:pimeloyl-ACP methyl ester carboxylesterase
MKSKSSDLEFIEINNSKLFYKKYGTGEKIMLAFHGYGQSHYYYQKFAGSLAEGYTTFAFDLFFHGKSVWAHNEKLLTKEEWNTFMKLFFEKYKIKMFSMVGFSMGGKFLLTTLEEYFEKVDQVIFIAPDGIKTNFWYSLATYPQGFRNIFKSFIMRPKGFFNIVQIMKKTGIMDKGILKFANLQMDTMSKRRKVYLTWVVFSLMKFDINKIAHLINSHHIKVDMYLGKYDKIITKNNMARLLRKLKVYQLNILNCGHNHLIDEVANQLK